MSRASEIGGYVPPDATREREQEESQLFTLRQEVFVIRSSGKVEPGWKINGVFLEKDGTIFYTLEKGKLKQPGVPQSELVRAQHEAAAAASSEKKSREQERDDFAKNLVRTRAAAGQEVEEIQRALDTLNQGEKINSAHAQEWRALENFSVMKNGRRTSVTLNKGGPEGRRRYFLSPGRG
ncbi:MAG: hypothetical protein WC702_04365 [Patescibacteria group bacterium]|jgi:hypothetical protein